MHETRARQLHISKYEEKSVSKGKKYFDLNLVESNIFDKLKLRDRTHAALYEHEKGII